MRVLMCLSPIEPTTLLDLDDDLLAAVAMATSNAQTRCHLAESCTALYRLIMSDIQARALIWAPLVRAYRPLKPDRLPSSSLYNALSSLKRLSWTPLTLEAPRPSIRHQLEGRTGTASCRLEGEALVFGGTLNGNVGPLLGDLLHISHDRSNGLLSLRPAREQRSEARPGPRRGHTMTASSISGRPVAVVLGGWGEEGEEDMTPHILRATPHGYEWSRPAVSGAIPVGRAFHSVNETAPGQLVTYGGLGSGCCRNDLNLLVLSTMEWTLLSIDGVPRCSFGRAGHCAVFVPCAAGVDGSMSGANDSGAEAGSPGLLSGGVLDSVASGRAGHLIFICGASRSISGDSHQTTVDAIEVGRGGAPLRWSDDPSWASISLPAVRTAAYVVLARHVVVWGGVGQDHTPERSVQLLDVDRRRERVAELASSSIVLCGPPPRAGALLVQLGPEEAVLLCGSDHEDEEDMLTPYLLQLELPN